MLIAGLETPDRGRSRGMVSRWQVFHLINGVSV